MWQYIKMYKLNTFVFIDLKVLMNVLHKILLQKIGGMFQEALAMPAPVMNQASPAPSQGIMDTTSYPLQSHGGISFSQSQVGMHVLQFLSLAKPYMHTYAWNARIVIHGLTILPQLCASIFQDNGSYLMQSVGEQRQELLNQLVFSNMCSFQ